MLIAHSMPAVTGLDLTGATWLTADGGTALHDGKPARVARLQATSAPSITASFGAAFKPRVIGLLGLRGIAPGTIITAKGADGSALGGNAGSQPVVRFADGTLGAWIVTDGTVSTASLVVTIAGTGQIDIGELVAMPAADIAIDAGWVQALIDPTEALRGRGSQVSQTARPAYRELSVAFSLAPEAAVRYGGLPDGMDWERLAAALSGRQRCVPIPRWKGQGGTVDATKLQAHAMYGIASEIGETRHMRGPFWAKTMRFEEIPASI
jgi:hypothetical protein